MPYSHSMLFKLTLPALFALAVAGCDTEGPAEEAGERVDRAVKRAGEAVENAGERAREQTRR